MCSHLIAGELRRMLQTVQLVKTVSEIYIIFNFFLSNDLITSYF